MAYPVEMSYEAESGATMYIGCEAPVEYPSWRAAQAPMSWAQIPTTNTLSDLDPAKDLACNPNAPGSALWSGNSGHASVTTAYGGGCHDKATSTNHKPLQGGHQDYSGNEYYKICYNADAPTYVMLRPPSGASNSSPLVVNLVNDSTQQLLGTYTDGRVRSIHGYNRFVYVPGVGPYCFAQGDTFPGGYGTLKSIIFDEVTGESVLTAESCPIDMNSGPGACYDELRNAIWARNVNGTRFVKKTLSDNVYALFGDSVNVSGYAGLESIEEHDCIFWANDYFATNFAILDRATGATTQPSVTGSTVGMSLSGECNPQWVSDIPGIGSGVAVWDNSTDTRTINVFVPSGDPRTDPWEIVQLPAAGGTPSAANSQGTFKHFGYDPVLNGFFLDHKVDEAPWFYALD